MKHAGSETFAQLDDLLTQLRQVPELTERRTGVFYRRSRAFLHFHADPTGPYADLRVHNDQDFVRFRVRAATERTRLLREVRAAIPS